MEKERETGGGGEVSCDNQGFIREWIGKRKEEKREAGDNEVIMTKGV